MTSAELLPQTYELVDIDKLTPHPDNPRSGDVDVIGASVVRHGFYGALIVQRATNNVLVGNHRMMAAKAQGIEQLPVLWVDVTDTEAERLMLVDNRTGERATWDYEQLAAVLVDVQAHDADLSALGWEPHELEGLLGAEWNPPVPDQDLEGFHRDDGGHSVRFSAEGWVVMSDAIDRAREDDEDLSEEAALVAVARGYIG